MAEISVKSVFLGITSALHRAFPDSKIHTRPVKQGLSDGDIQIISLVEDSGEETAERCKRSLSAVVVYYPCVSCGISMCAEIGEKIKKALSKIETSDGDILFGLSPSLDIGNGERPIIFNIKYVFFSRKNDTEEAAIDEIEIKFGGIYG